MKVNTFLYAAMFIALLLSLFALAKVKFIDDCPCKQEQIQVVIDDTPILKFLEETRDAMIIEETKRSIREQHRLQLMEDQVEVWNKIYEKHYSPY